MKAFLFFSAFIFNVVLCVYPFDEQKVELNHLQTSLLCDSSAVKQISSVEENNN